MKIIHLSTLGLAIIMGLTATFAQEKKKARVSPPEVVSANIDGNEVKISYGRPSVNDPKSGEVRKIWGGLVPYGKVWRTGANEATVLSIEKPITIGGYDLPAGKYSLFTVPTEGGEGSKLILNKRTGQWGIPYNEAQEKENELARVDLKRGSNPTNLERFTITIEKTGAGRGQIKFAWADAFYSIDFKNKS